MVKEGVRNMLPEEKARLLIDEKLKQSGWVLQDMREINPMASLGVAVREYPTSTGPVDYALFVDGKPVGVVEAKKDEAGENITTVEHQSGRYANSTFKYVTIDRISGQRALTNSLILCSTSIQFLKQPERLQ